MKELVRWWIFSDNPADQQGYVHVHPGVGNYIVNEIQDPALGYRIQDDHAGPPINDKASHR